MGIVARTDLVPGQRLDAEAIGFAFPVAGIGAESVAQLEGARVVRSIARGEPVSWDALERPGEAG
jgi:Flp pilus assembly protein CpaB